MTAQVVNIADYLTPRPQPEPRKQRKRITSFYEQYPLPFFDRAKLSAWSPDRG
jgi:hypothetical protein